MLLTRFKIISFVIVHIVKAAKVIAYWWAWAVWVQLEERGVMVVTNCFEVVDHYSLSSVTTCERIFTIPRNSKI